MQNDEKKQNQLVESEKEPEATKKEFSCYEAIVTVTFPEFESIPGLEINESCESWKKVINGIEGIITFEQTMTMKVEVKGRTEEGILQKIATLKARLPEEAEVRVRICRVLFSSAASRDRIIG